MPNILIQNKASTVEIDLIGDIGEGWFDEGITMESVRSMLKENKGKNLIINVSSLGGDVNDGLAIHDFIKIHSGKTTARIIGLTASAGTLVALGADNVEISENALFLVHNAWTIALGNSMELRDMADQLDKIDSRLVNIYQKKTGKRKSQIYTLMEKEDWLTPDEAKEFGFVDKIFQPSKMAASFDKQKLINIKSKINKIEKMNLFKNKDSKVINTIALDDGTVLIHEGELENGVEVLKSGEKDANLEGEHILADGRTLKISGENKVTEIIEAPNEQESEIEATNKRLDEVFDVLEDLTKQITDIKTKGSTHKPDKNEKVDQDNPKSQKAEINVRSTQRERMNAIKAKVNKTRELT